MTKERLVYSCTSIIPIVAVVVVAPMESISLRSSVRTGDPPA